MPCYAKTKRINYFTSKESRQSLNSRSPKVLELDSTDVIHISHFAVSTPGALIKFLSLFRV